MKRLFRRLLGCAVAVLLAPVLVHAQAAGDSLSRNGGRGAPVPRFETFTVADGLPANEIDAILQDRQGFLWVGTWSGLSRYDGASFTSFRYDPADSLGLSNGWVWDLHEDRAGRLWIGTDGGLSRFDPATETFTNYRPDPANPGALGHSPVRAVLEDAAGMIWVGTQGAGLSRLDPATGVFTHYRHDPDDPESLDDDDVYALAADPEGTLWVGTPRGLSRLDPATEKFMRYDPAPGDPARRAPPDVFALLKDRTGTLWAGSVTDGLFRLDPSAGSGPAPATGVFTHYAADPTDPGALGQEWVLSLFEDRAGTLWVGTDGGGLHRYDPAADAFVRYVYDPSDPQSLSDDRALVISEDRAGVLWVGTHGGLNRRYPLSRHLAHERHRSGEAASLNVNDVTAFLEDRTGALWVGTDGGGLNRRDPSTGTFAHYRHAPRDSGSLGNDEVMTLAEDDDGALWVGTYDGLYRRDPATRRFSRFTAPSDSGGSWTFQTTISLVYKDGHLWAGTYDGLFDIDLRTGRTVRFVPDPGDPAAPDYRYILSVYPEGPGVVWVGTFEGGFGRLDPATGAFTHRYDGQDPDALRWGQITSIHRGRSGALWVGTEEGLVRMKGERPLEEKGTAFTRFRQAEGLPDPTVNDILEDAGGRLWVTTVQGLSWFDRQTETFVSYGAADGLPSGGKIYQSPRTGTIYLGSTRGYYAFDPADIVREPPPTPLVLTALRLLGDPVRVGAEGSVLDRPMWMTEALRLRHDDRVVSFAFAALDFRAPSKHRYAVRLDGFDEGWREVGRRREATFTNLGPGRYTFRVRVAGRDGVWSKEEASVRLRVLPPWWRTTAAYLLYGFLLLAGIFTVDRVQRRRLAARERERAREHELAQKREIERAYTELQATKDQLVQQEKLASLGQLTAGIAHEIKNPLNFVNNFSALSAELAEELGAAAEAGDLEEVQLLADDLKANSEVIEKHGKRADGIVRSMMAHARTSSGEREPVDLNALVDEYVDLAYHGMRARHADFNCRIERDYDEAVGEVAVVPQEIGRVLINLLNNAFDAVHEQAMHLDGQYAPTVQVSTRRAGEEVEIRIEDNGPGVPAAVREQIFEPFFTTKPAGEGTGLGLSMSYDIVTQGHGGTLAVESAEGAAFVVRLPQGASAPAHG